MRMVTHCDVYLYCVCDNTYVDVDRVLEFMQRSRGCVGGVEIVSDFWACRWL